MLVEIIHWSALDSVEYGQVLGRPALHDAKRIQDQVESILQTVKSRGDNAIRRLTREFDGADMGSFKVDEQEIADAAAHLDGTAIDAIDLAIDNVRQFHEQQSPGTIRVETMPGVVCERISHPLDAVGLYVPAGSAPLPSAAIMLAVPASIAGCPTRVLCTPPRSDGTADPAVLVAASRAGVSDIFKIGGAQAIGAMAYGTASVPRVRKIFGPGNAWVTCAKTIVGSQPGGPAIDMPAGPSEVLVIADADADAAFVAADLLAQAEHGPDSQVILLTSSEELAIEVQTCVAEQLESLSRAPIVRASLAHARIIVTDDIESAIEISNAYAPEHLILQVTDPRGCLEQVRNAGSVFLGRWTPESVGDYCSGTNHVLPTYGYAQAYSGLSVEQFMRFMTVQELSREGLEGIGPAVQTLAGIEGLDAHAVAVSRRLEISE